MRSTLRAGDRAAWASEAGQVSGVIIGKITSDTFLKGRVRHASRAEPRYVIHSDRTDHIAIHKASALMKLRRRPRPRAGGRRAGSGADR